MCECGAAGYIRIMLVLREGGGEDLFEKRVQKFYLRKPDVFY